MIGSARLRKDSAMRLAGWRVLSLTLWLGCQTFCPLWVQAQLKSNPLVCSKPDTSLQLQDVHRTSPGLGGADEHYAQAERFESAGDQVRAEAEFKAAVASMPAGDKYVRRLALFEIERERHDDALGVIRDYVKACGPTSLGWSLEAELLFKKKQYDGAYEAAQHSLALSNEDARMHEMVGLIYVVKRQNGAAVLELKKAAELDSESAQIRYFYGRTLYTTGRYQEARDAFLACLKLQPEYPRAQENLGLCYEALQEFPKAFDCYRQAIAGEETKKGQKNAEPYAFYGRSLLDQRQTSEGLAVLRRAVEVSSRSFIANYELGRGLLSSGELKEAEHFLLVAKDLDPQYPQTHYLLGKLCQREQRPREAAQHWARFENLNRNPENRDLPITDR